MSAILLRSSALCLIWLCHVLDGNDPANRETRLILSSEWDYSPFMYDQITDLPSFVFIGLPACESANPLLLPLAGHELGHSVWVKNDSRNGVQVPSYTIGN